MTPYIFDSEEDKDTRKMVEETKEFIKEEVRSAEKSIEMRNATRFAEWVNVNFVCLYYKNYYEWLLKQDVSVAEQYQRKFRIEELYWIFNSIYKL